MKTFKLVGEGKPPKKNKKVKILTDSERDELLAKNNFKNHLLKEILKSEIKEAKIKLAKLKNGY